MPSSWAVENGPRPGPAGRRDGRWTGRVRGLDAAATRARGGGGVRGRVMPVARVESSRRKRTVGLRSRSERRRSGVGARGVKMRSPLAGSRPVGVVEERSSGRLAVFVRTAAAASASSLEEWMSDSLRPATRSGSVMSAGVVLASLRP